MDSVESIIDIPMTESLFNETVVAWENDIESLKSLPDYLGLTVQQYEAAATRNNVRFRPEGKLCSTLKPS